MSNNPGPHKTPTPPSPGKRPRPPRQVLAAVIAAVWLAVVFGMFRGDSNPDPVELRVTDLLAIVDDTPDAIAKVQLDDGALAAWVHLDEDALDGWDPDRYTGIDGEPVDLDGHDADDDTAEVLVRLPVRYSAELLAVLHDAGIDVEARRLPSSNMARELFLTLLPVAAIVLVLWFLLGRKGAGGIGKFDKSKTSAVDRPDTTFADVAGIDEVVDELTELVSYLKDPGRYANAGVRASKGVLLEGPPGVGKTLVARAVAGEAGVPFLSVSGSDFQEVYVGVGARRVRDLYAAAKKAGRAIIFIDEIDAVGKTRASGPSTGANDERESTLNALLVEMDGFDSHGIIVIAATNRADLLDPALVRPGRFDTTITVPAPDRAGRHEILAVHSRSRSLHDDVDLEAIARRTPGMTGAELADLVNEAARVAVRDGRDTIRTDDFDEAIATKMMGRARKGAVVTDFDRSVTAWHEAGHALAALCLPDAADPVSVTIIPRGAAGGVTWMDGTDEVFMTRRRALAQLQVMLGGRAAEMLLLDGDFTSGASSDLAQATKLATQMAAGWGMTGAGLAADIGDGSLARSDKVRDTVNDMLADALTQVTELLQAAPLATVADALLEHETLDTAALRAIVDDGDV